MESESKKFKLTTPVSVIIAGVIIAGAILWTGHASTPTPTAIAQQGQTQTAPQTADISKVKIAGEPFIGNPNASVTIAFWFDYQCPFCKKFETEVMPQIVKDYVDTGKVRVIFKDFQFLGQDSQTLGQFSRAVWAVAPDKFYEWHKAIYDNSGTENSGWATHDKIMSITSGVLGTSVATQVAQLVVSQGANYQKLMDADKAEGGSFGVSGTPSTLIGKQMIVGAQPYSAVKQLIDSALQGK
jgi:protein-disulfide isomerase